MFPLFRYQQNSVPSFRIESIRSARNFFPFCRPLAIVTTQSKIFHRFILPWPPTLIFIMTTSSPIYAIFCAIRNESESILSKFLGCDKYFGMTFQTKCLGIPPTFLNIREIFLRRSSSWRLHRHLPTLNCRLTCRYPDLMSFHRPSSEQYLL